MGGIVVGSVRQTPVMVGKTPALLLGPLAVRPEWKKRGIGGKLMRMSLEAARKAGHKLVILVGDEPITVHSGSRWWRRVRWSCQRLSIRAGCSPANLQPAR